MLPQCRDHTCALYPSCTHPRADPIRGLFCEDHECADTGCRKQKYDSGGVTGLPSRTGVWCADHMCMAALTRREDCVNRRAGTGTNPLYCADHELCEEAECNNFRAVRGRNRIQARCEEREFACLPLITYSNALLSLLTHLQTSSPNAPSQPVPSTPKTAPHHVATTPAAPADVSLPSPPSPPYLRRFSATPTGAASLDVLTRARLQAQP